MTHTRELFVPVPTSGKEKPPVFLPERLQSRELVVLGPDRVERSNEEIFSAFEFQYHGNTSESCSAQYRYFLQGYPENIARNTRAILEKNAALNELMMTVAQFNEVVSLGSTLLYERALLSDRDRNENEEKRQRKNWYIETVEHCMEVHASIQGLIHALKAQTQDEKFHTFISDFQQELELLVADALNLATGIAAHLTRSNCAVFIGDLPVKIPDNINFGNVLSLFGEYSGKKRTVYDQYSYNLLSSLRNKQRDFLEGKAGSTMYVPALVSAFDAAEFAKELNLFFKELRQGLSNVVFDPHTDQFRLGENIEILIRPDATANAQSRINFRGINDFSGFSLRIDKESERLAMDVGGYSYSSLIKIVGAIARATQRGESIMDYSHFLENGGAGTARRVMYKPVNQNPEEIPNITKGDFMAYVAAFAMSLSKDMQMRRYFSAFSYHSRAFLATDPEHHEHFAENATTMREVLQTISSEQKN